METYKNDYTKEEDELLWEIHEIRHELHKEWKAKTLEQINRDALEKFQGWKENMENK